MATASRFSPAADRNKAPILAVLEEVLPAEAAVLEIASGNGQHAAYFAAAHPSWTWQPTDGDAQAMTSIAAQTEGITHARQPLLLDVRLAEWPLELGRFDAVYCANMLHIAEWSSCAGLMQGASRHLVPGGVLVLYGPYRVDGEPLAPSNATFDADLRARNSAWGLRQLSLVVDEAKRAGLTLERRWNMAANNLMLALRSRSTTT